MHSIHVHTCMYVSDIHVQSYMYVQQLNHVINYGTIFYARGLSEEFKLFILHAILSYSGENSRIVLWLSQWWRMVHCKCAFQVGSAKLLNKISNLKFGKQMWPRMVKPTKSRWTPIQDTANFRPMGCYTALLVFFTDYTCTCTCSSRMFISQFPANKITEIDLEVCEKAKFRAPFLRLLVRFFLFIKCVFLEIIVSLFFDFQSP